MDYHPAIPSQEQDPTQPQQGPSEDIQEIIEFGSSTLRGGKHAVHCLTVVGQIEGHQLLPAQNKTTKYEHVLPQLAAIEEAADIDGLLVLLNTVGGDIEAGLAIAELISGMETPTVSLVLGGGHSIGVPLAVSARRSLIAPSSAMTIHPVRLGGVILGVPQTLHYFQKVQERIVRFVVRNSRVDEHTFLTLMHRTDELAGDVGSVIYGQEAVDMGLIDRVGGLSDALGELHEMIDRKKEESAPDPQNGEPEA